MRAAEWANTVSNLHELYLSWNRIHVKTFMERLVDRRTGITKSCLRLLDLSHNTLSVQGAASLAMVGRPS